jgi:hypothetical protein
LHPQHARWQLLLHTDLLLAIPYLHCNVWAVSRRCVLGAFGSQRLDRRDPKPPSVTKVGPEFGNVLRKRLWLKQFCQIPL